MKKYKISELSALQKKFAKVEVELSLDEENNSGRSIMVNLNTMIFEVTQPKNAKAITEEGTEADVEYHLDVQFKVKEEVHEVKLILYTTNCRIRVQHAGKKQCQPYEYLKNCCPPK